MNSSFFAVSAIALLLVVVVVVSGREVKFTTKQNDGADMTKVELWPCQNEADNDNPCKLTRGQVINSRLTFTPKKAVNTLKTVNYVVVFGRAIPVATMNACDNLLNGAKCPLVAGTSYVFQGTSSVPSIIPGLIHSLTFQSAFEGDNDEKLVSVEFPIKL